LSGGIKAAICFPSPTGFGIFRASIPTGEQPDTTTNMPMKVVILCGGLGTRLREETEFRPKPMVPIGGQPILWHIMKIFAARGHKDFILCLGYKGEIIKEYFRNYHWNTSDVTLTLGAQPKVRYHSTHDEEDWTVTLLETGLQTQTGGRLKRALPFVEDDNFLMTYGDGLTDSDVNAAIRLHEESGRTATLTAIQPAGRFGELGLNQEVVTEFREKPVTEDGFINGGFFVFLAKEGQLNAYRHRGFWQCMDTYREQQMLEAMWQSGKAPWKTW
jgi:glucose-1-phosphate cytidylyltransferase